MYNNKVTYAEKWNTPENIGFLAKLDKKYFPRALCSSSCPLSWAQEVYTFLEYLDVKYGIVHTTQTIDGCTIPYTYKPFKRLFIRPFERLHRDVLAKPERYVNASDEEHADRISYWKESLTVKNIVGHLWWHFSYAVRTLIVQAKAATYNSIRNPKVKISQIKEKFGSLRVYYDIDNESDREHIDSKIKELENLLSLKGVYYET